MCNKWREIEIEMWGNDDVIKTKTKTKQGNEQSLYYFEVSFIFIFLKKEYIRPKFTSSS